MCEVGDFLDIECFVVLLDSIQLAKFHIYLYSQSYLKLSLLVSGTPTMNYR